MMFRRALFALLLTATTTLHAAAVRGRVLDANGTPLAGAVVSSESVHTRSGADGSFVLDLPPGEHVLQVAKERFVETAQSVLVAEHGAHASDFILDIATLQESIVVTAPSGYAASSTTTATKVAMPLRDVPQSVTVVTRELMQDQLMTSIADVIRYVPGVTMHQGENNRDQVIMRGNSSSADFFVDGVRDDVQYYRDLYNLERVEALKGPNAMIFGRGGAGGVVNRVTKEAGFGALRAVDLQGGAWGNQRVSADFDQPLGERFALRLNGVYERSGGFRDGFELHRSGIAPTLTFLPDDDTKVTLAFEHFRDQRVADRGITSYRGRPADVAIDTFYGNPNDSHVQAAVNLASASVERHKGALGFRNRTLVGDYDRFYQNYVPGAVSADKSLVTLTAYNNATNRRNVFNQTDVTYELSAGSMKHTLLGGVEVGRQLTDNFRNTGYFFNTATSVSVGYANPTVSMPVVFRQSATDADNHLRTAVGALYAQDVVEVSPHLQFIAGLRVDRFDLRYDNRRNGDRLDRVDQLVSPRAGVVVKPIAALSFYGSYSVSYLPSSGDQFSSLTAVTDQLKPEKFDNYELGAKWDVRNDLSLTAAVYRLDRTNTRSTDPADPTRIVQTGSQRSNGLELGANGRITPIWSIAGGYAYQDAFVTSATAAAREGAQAGQVPHHTFSLWNHVQLRPRIAAAVGVIYRSQMFATIDNSVVLPAYTRIDAAAYYTVTKDLRLQVNIENALDTRYYANADSNTNISPGSPRTARVGISARF
jgi:catecholate siderophore receptor